MARQLGLEIDYIHAPCDNPNDLWLDGINGDHYLNTLFSCVDDCNRHCVPTAVIHITRLSLKPIIAQIGMERLKRLVDFAERKQVNLAIENLNTINHLDYIYAKI